MALSRTCLLAALFLAAAGLQLRQPIIEDPSVVNAAGEAGTAAGEGLARQPAGYRNAWEDCSGVGASATERTRSVAATIHGFARTIPFLRNAAQDCGHVEASGMKGGVAVGSKIVYPGPKVWRAASDGLATASDALAKYAAP